MEAVSELQSNIEMTQIFLKENSRDIVLTRHTRTRSNTGGWTATEQALPPQPFAIIGPTAGLRRAPEVATDVGSLASYHLSLVGQPEANIEDGDTFILDSGKYRVDFVFPEHDYKTHAVIVYEGLVAPGG